MKRKSLERAVFFTVLMMSLHNGAWADNIQPITNTDYTFSSSGTYVVDNKNGTAISATGGNTTNVNLGSNDVELKFKKDASGTFAFFTAADKSNIVVTGGNLKINPKGEEQSQLDNGLGFMFDIRGGASIDLKNDSTVIGTGGDGVTAQERRRNFGDGLLIYTYDTDDAKSKFNADGNLTMYVSLRARDNYMSDDYARAGMRIQSSEVKTKGNTIIDVTNYESDNLSSTYAASQGESIGVMVGHRYVDTAGINKDTTKASTVTFGNDANDTTTIIARHGRRTAGLWIEEGKEQDVVTFNGTANITAYGGGADAKSNNNSSEYCGTFGVRNVGGKLTFNGDANITAQKGLDTPERIIGLDLEKGENNFNGLLNVTASTTSSTGSTKLTAINAKGTSINAASALITAKGKSDNTGIIAENSTINFTGDVSISADSAITATSGSTVDMQSGFNGAASSKNVNTVMSADGAGTSIKINSGKSGVVTYTGTTSVSNSGTIEMNLTEENSVWNMTGNSKLTTLESHLNTVIDMTQDNGAFSTLTVETLTAGKDNDGGIIKMNIDGDAEKTADRLYITGEHTGNHYISIDDTVTDTAVGTVLVSVGTEKGTFAAEKTEGALYWKDYDLEQVENAEAGDAYNTDWVIAAVKQDEGRGTTSVDTIVGANALNYHTWRAENDQLMQRMGELRNNGSDEQGAWFRMHGAEISHDDIAGFENKYTTYELGYDQITKQTENMTRYTGAALSYTDGSSSYNSGSGENHSKAISFYNTDVYSSGHYLDLVFKFANMDNDFSVYDTKGQNITGEYKNNGISLSAEYGRKNEMANGWYIEPQAQLTLGYFGGDEYEASNGIKVNQGGIASVLGRAGFNLGKELGSNGVIYAKASLLHEFAGDYDIRMTDSTGISRNESASFNDTWFEYGVGAALKTGKNNHLYFDFVKTAGGSFEKDWQWNAGMRWTF